MAVRFSLQLFVFRCSMGFLPRPLLGARQSANKLLVTISETRLGCWVYVLAVSTGAGIAEVAEVLLLTAKAFGLTINFAAAKRKRSLDSMAAGWPKPVSSSPAWRSCKKAAARSRCSR